MPKYEIELSDEANAGLKRIVARWNADQGQDLGTADWLLLHVKDLVIADDLVAARETFLRQAEENALAALRAERDRMLAALG